MLILIGLQKASVWAHKHTRAHTKTQQS